MKPILKYPRTPHLLGSSRQRGDEDLAIVSPEDLRGCFLVAEEKVDGANSAISFDDDSELILQSRGHVLSGGPRERQFDLFKRWANAHRGALSRVLGNRYTLYGEWLYARHTIRYDFFGATRALCGMLRICLESVSSAKSRFDVPMNACSAFWRWRASR